MVPNVGRILGLEKELVVVLDIAPSLILIIDKKLAFRMQVKDEVFDRHSERNRKQS
jgi:hypothetical protein